MVTRHRSLTQPTLSTKPAKRSICVCGSAPKELSVACVRAGGGSDSPPQSHLGQDIPPAAAVTPKAKSLMRLRSQNSFGGGASMGSDANSFGTVAEELPPSSQARERGAVSVSQPQREE